MTESITKISGKLWSNSDKSLLKKLFSGGRESESAWKTFLNTYSKLFLKIVWNFTGDHNDAMEKYLYVCTKLCKDDFAILKKFDFNRTPAPKLSTWLTVVVSNLCREEFRKSRGRFRLPRAIQKLSEIEKQIFVLYYIKKYNREEIRQKLNLDADDNTVNDSLFNIEFELTENKAKKYLKKQKPVMVSFDENINPYKPTAQSNNVDEILNNLNRWLETLEKPDRMVIKLKFWEDLSAKEISDLLKIPQRSVYSILEKNFKNFRERIL